MSEQKKEPTWSLSDLEGIQAVLEGFKKSQLCSDIITECDGETEEYIKCCTNPLITVGEILENVQDDMEAIQNDLGPHYFKNKKTFRQLARGSFYFLDATSRPTETYGKF